MPSVFDMHVHTNKGSPDSSLTPEELLSEGSRIGLTGALMPEHNGWPRHDFEEFMLHREPELVLVRGLEVYTPMGHVIALGLEGHVTGFQPGIESIRQLRKVVDQLGGFLILAHPFRFLFDPPGIYTQNKLFEDPAALPATPKEAALHPIFELVHEVEVVNGGNVEEENRFAQGVVKVLGLKGTGGSDCHSTHGLGKGVTIFDGDIRNERDLLDALRAKAILPVEGFHVGRPSSYGDPEWEYLIPADSYRPA